MSVLGGNPLLLGDDGYNISRSVRLRQSASASFTRTFPSAGSRTTWTWSAWCKRGSLGTPQSLFEVNSGNGYNRTYFYLKADNTLTFNDYGAASTNGTFNTTQVFRDPSAWLHIVLTFDTTNATAGDRIRLYVNGQRVTTFSAQTNPSLNFAGNCNTARQHIIGDEGYSPQFFDGYLTEINFIDGQALTPASFGETDSLTGVWKPKKYVGTYGTNGFYLNFSDNSASTAAAIGKDWSGNGNNWTPNNVSVTAGVTYDSMLDVPTMYADGGNGRGNYCTLNPLNKNASSITVLNGNLGISTSASNVGVAGTIGVSADKWYWETTFTNASGVPSIGAATAAWDKSYAGYTGSVGYHGNGVIYNNGSNVQSGLASYTSGDVIGVALDMGAGSITFYKNNTQVGTTITGLTGEWFPAVAGQTSSTLAANFGQRPFAYTPPTGFKALNTQNLPDATIKKGNAYFDVSTYTGNGSTQSIVNSGAMQPDFIWFKKRNAATHHALVDSVRGADKYLYSSLTIAEETQTTALSSFNANGFSFAGSFGNVNTSGDTYAAWQWKESVSAGFDIVTYTGTGALRTIAHSLGVAPKMVIVKSRSAGSTNWCVQHASVGNNYVGYMNLTNAFTTNASMWNNTSPTSSVFTVNTNTDVNGNGTTYVAYLFAEVAGYSKFGSYTGNGSADGPFVYLGFRPKYVLVKRTDTTGEWLINDSARDSYNPEILYLQPHLSSAEGTLNPSLDFISNGFKLRTTNANYNASGGTYIYAAFAENPFKNSLAR